MVRERLPTPALERRPEGDRWPACREAPRAAAEPARGVGVLEHLRGARSLRATGSAGRTSLDEPLSPGARRSSGLQDDTAFLHAYGGLAAAVCRLHLRRSPRLAACHRTSPTLERALPCPRLSLPPSPLS